VPYTIEMARILAPYGLTFIEEPVPPWDLDGYAAIRRGVDATRIAGGEHAYTRYAARELLRNQAVDILQPDIRWTGGLSEVIQICDLAESHAITVMPHRGGMAWSLHLIATRTNCPLAEAMVLTAEEAALSVFQGEPLPQGGYLSVSDAPGFGLELNEAMVTRLGTMAS
jgi:L-alanine-DL-glutamate epimerase-like enolase superfamily enzyme